MNPKLRRFILALYKQRSNTGKLPSSKKPAGVVFKSRGGFSEESIRRKLKAEGLPPHYAPEIARHLKEGSRPGNLVDSLRVVDWLAEHPSRRNRVVRAP
ncbi:Uncharacterised protein [Candidatus Norongarragalina meridionalis]|nr:Uncharacterised protein [Candidatus Norongarragalina meridionalis]